MLHEVIIPLKEGGPWYDIGFKEGRLLPLYSGVNVGLFAAEMVDQLRYFQDTYKGAGGVKIILSPFLLYRLGGVDVLRPAIEYLFRVSPLLQDTSLGPGGDPIQTCLYWGSTWV